MFCFSFVCLLFFMNLGIGLNIFNWFSTCFLYEIRSVIDVLFYMIFFLSAWQNPCYSLLNKDVFCFIQHFDPTANYVGSCFYADAVVIVSAVILLFLFLLQGFGTHKVSFLFSPIMVAWFLSTALIGVYNIIIYYPGVFKALSPHYPSLFHASWQAWMGNVGSHRVMHNR